MKRKDVQHIKLSTSEVKTDAKKVSVSNTAEGIAIKSSYSKEDVSDLKHFRLIEYLNSRKINISLAKKYLKEIHFTIIKNDSFNFALAIENELNGFEFRNIFMKGSINGKSYTLINPGNDQDIAIFEGFIDFLSFLTDHNLQDFKSTVLILNSANLRNETLAVFEKHSYKKAYCFLDNDKAGQETLEFYKENLILPIIDKSTIYKNFDDYNECLKSKRL